MNEIDYKKREQRVWYYVSLGMDHADAVFNAQEDEWKERNTDAIDTTDVNFQQGLEDYKKDFGKRK